MMQDKLISSGWHWSYGWLRRPDKDNHTGYCYEEPDGSLVYTARRDHNLLCRLELLENPVTGKRRFRLAQEKTRELIFQYGGLNSTVRGKSE